jgi:hypothetical protein
MQSLESKQVRADIFADGGVRTPSSLNGFDPVTRKSVVSGQELGVLAKCAEKSIYQHTNKDVHWIEEACLPGKDVIRDSAQIVLVSQSLAKSEHQSGLSRSYRPGIS